MKRSKFSEGEIFKILKLGESGMPVAELCREYKVSQPTYYSWRSKYGGMDLPMMKKLKGLEEENRRLKKMYAEVCMDKEVLQQLIGKKALKPEAKRELVHHILKTQGYSIRRVCELVWVNRGTFGYKSIREGDREVIEVVSRLAESKLRWGFGKIYDWLKLQGHHWNHKRVRRIYRELKLKHRIKPKKRLPNRTPKRLEVPQKANGTWSMDFMSDSLEMGRKFRTLNVIDNHNREVLAIEIDYSIPAERVVRVLNQIAEERGIPDEIRVDNGREFMSVKLESWAESNSVKLEHIKPGKPTQNAFIERFNKTYREDILDLYIFRTLDDVRDITSEWMYDYNHFRPHKALGWIPPRALLNTF
ncbi:MAG: IS3 family transposase [Candidatus Margulisiibacteriota bacterium]